MVISLNTYAYFIYNVFWNFIPWLIIASSVSNVRVLQILREEIKLVMRFLAVESVKLGPRHVNPAQFLERLLYIPSSNSETLLESRSQSQEVWVVQHT
jgi:hypothetical protein